MDTKYEVIIIGGSYAGLAAAMALGRSLRNVLVIDSGEPCNRFTPHSHNFITQDGETPAAIASKAKEQVLKYPSVQFFKDKVTDAKQTGDGFIVSTENSMMFTAKKLLFATGVTDILPDIEGFAECWGISVVHCPYCHGYEAKEQKTAVFANGEAAMHYAKLLRQLTNNLTFFTNGPAEFDEDTLDKLKEHNMAIIEDKVAAIKQNNGHAEQIIMENGVRHDFPVIYYRPQNKQHCDIPQHLGCSINEMGYIAVNEMQLTTVPGVYAAGDNTTPMRSVSIAVASGMKAGAAINFDLASEYF